MDRWIKVCDRMPDRKEAGKEFYCVHQTCMGRWIGKTILCDPLELEFEPETEDESIYFSLNCSGHGAVTQIKTKITHWRSDFELPEIDDGLFRNLGKALNPNTAIELLSEILEGE